MEKSKENGMEAGPIQGFRGIRTDIVVLVPRFFCSGIGHLFKPG